MNKAEIKGAVAGLEDKINTFRKELKKHEDALKALQLLCAHDWEYDGHGHNDDYYKCKVCKAQETR
jgi:hypothetical protein